jgi:hypothetical protein
VKEAKRAVSKRFGQISRNTSHVAEIQAIKKAVDTLDASGERRVSRRRPEQEKYDTVMTH